MLRLFRVREKSQVVHTLFPLPGHRLSSALPLFLLLLVPLIFFLLLPSPCSEDKTKVGIEYFIFYFLLFVVLL
jgi:hypothetical protein